MKILNHENGIEHIYVQKKIYRKLLTKHPKIYLTF